ncbi:MAG: thioredoxin family protein [Raineya sp.]|jgi:peroxiredoxin|nr:thioredoxin family protein [Raineya sp.]
MKKLFASISILAMALLLFVNATNKGGYKPGDKVKDFNLKNIDGNMVSLKSMKDVKGAIVVFTCNHCPFSKMYEDRIIALDAQFKSKGYPVVAINPNDVKAEPDDSFENMIVRAKEKGFTFPYLVDETQGVATAFGATNTPHVFVLEKDKKANFVVRYVGAIDDSPKDATKATVKYVEDAINNLLSGKKVEKDQAKAIGCTIKWKKA